MTPIAYAAASLPPLLSEPERRSFLIAGRIVPYVRMTQRGKFVKPRAQFYLASKEAIRWQLQQQMAASGWAMLPERTPLAVRIEIGKEGGLHKSDLDNEVKAILDAAQGIVYRNDCWVDDIEAFRWLGGRDATRVEIECIGGSE